MMNPDGQHSPAPRTEHSLRSQLESTLLARGWTRTSDPLAIWASWQSPSGKIRIEACDLSRAERGRWWNFHAWTSGGLIHVRLEVESAANAVGLLTTLGLLRRGQHAPSCPLSSLLRFGRHVMRKTAGLINELVTFAAFMTVLLSIATAGQISTPALAAGVVGAVTLLSTHAWLLRQLARRDAMLVSLVEKCLGSEQFAVPEWLPADVVSRARKRRENPGS